MLGPKLHRLSHRFGFGLAFKQATTRIRGIYTHAMKIDPALCRQILAAIEVDPNAGGGQILDTSTDGYDEKTIAYHVKYLWETHMISGVEITCTTSPCVPEIGATDITPAGRSFLNHVEGEAEAAVNEHNGVFISHITEERTTAAVLKSLLQQTFGNNVRIFVSSDYVSISGGDLWFHAILKGLKSCAVVIVLLSPESLDRRWINFEAGVGIGAGATVIPVVIHGLELSDVGHPLCNLQIRSLQRLEEARALVQDIAKKLELAQNESVDFDALIMQVAQGTAESGWVGVQWNGSLLAVGGPLDKLPEREAQVYIEEMATALKAGGFKTHLANKYDLSRPIALGYKVVQITDGKTFRAELVRHDVVLVAKPEDSKEISRAGGPSFPR
jgi:hypothetical protein